jgi:hypothetical protein
VGILEFLAKIKKGPIYVGVLVGLTGLHGMRSWQHAERVEETMRPLAEQIQEKKKQDWDGKLLVKAVAEDLVQPSRHWKGQILPVEQARFIYNGNSCILQWELKK